MDIMSVVSGTVEQLDRSNDLAAPIDIDHVIALDDLARVTARRLLTEMPRPTMVAKALM
jgi:hypothetical protein